MNSTKYFGVLRDLCVFHSKHSPVRLLNVSSVCKFRFSTDKMRYNLRFRTSKSFVHTLLQRSYSIDPKLQMNPILPDLEEFNKSYHDVIDILTIQDPNFPSALSKRMIQVLNYNVQGGKKIRGLTVLLAARLLVNDLSEENRKSAALLGWCVELLQAFFLVSDDIMDNGDTRRGKPCWFRVPGIGLEALNDALFLESSIYQILKSRFSDLDCYSELISKFLEVTRYTIYGQSLDMSLHPHKQPLQLENFSSNHYKNVVEMKTAHYTYCLPIHLAMHLVGNFSHNDFKVAQSICMKLGYLFQCQDDYLDVYGDSQTTGKVGKDIVEGKCTWLAFTVLEDCTEEEKQIMKRCYGVDDPASVQQILKLYQLKSIKEKYLLKEKELYDNISSMVLSLDQTTLKKELFDVLLKNIYRRNK